MIFRQILIHVQLFVDEFQQRSRQWWEIHGDPFHRAPNGHPIHPFCSALLAEPYGCAGLGPRAAGWSWPIKCTMRFLHNACHVRWTHGSMVVVLINKRQHNRDDISNKNNFWTTFKMCSCWCWRWGLWRLWWWLMIYGASQNLTLQSLPKRFSRPSDWWFMIHNRCRRVTFL